MSYIDTLIISITQAITELYPISSSAHLILVTKFLNIEPSLMLLTSLHLGSALALIVVYRYQLNITIKKLLKIDKDEFLKYLFGITPAIIGGVLISGFIEDIFYGVAIIAFNLMFWGILMILIEYFEIRSKRMTRDVVSVRDSILIGMSQLLALIPGTSRSGITTMTGMLCGVRKDVALDFSFLIGIPLLLGAFFYEAIKDSDNRNMLNTQYIIGIIVTFIASLIALKFLRKFSTKRFLTLFGVYRIILGISLLLWLF